MTNVDSSHFNCTTEQWFGQAISIGFHWEPVHIDDVDCVFLKLSVPFTPYNVKTFHFTFIEPFWAHLRQLYCFYSYNILSKVRDTNSASLILPLSDYVCDRLEPISDRHFPTLRFEMTEEFDGRIDHESRCVWYIRRWTLWERCALCENKPVEVRKIRSFYAVFRQKTQKITQKNRLFLDYARIMPPSYLSYTFVFMVDSAVKLSCHLKTFKNGDR